MLKYSFGQEFMVAPTDGLDGEVGMVRVVLIASFDALKDSPYPVDAYLSDDDDYDAELKNGVWYGFEYLDPKNREIWSTIVLPETLLDEMVEAGKKVTPA